MMMMIMMMMMMNRVLCVYSYYMPFNVGLPLYSILFHLNVKYMVP